MLTEIKKHIIIGNNREYIKIATYNLNAGISPRRNEAVR